MNRIKKVRNILVSFLLTAPIIVLAQAAPPNPGGTGLRDLSFGGGLVGFLDTIIKLILIFAGTLAVLFLIIGGYQYITSAGNEELAERGKKNVQNAIIGIIIIILSYTIVRVIFTSLAGP